MQIGCSGNSILTKQVTIAFDEFIMAIQKLTGATRAMDMISLMHDAKVMKHQVAQLLKNQQSFDRSQSARKGASIDLTSSDSIRMPFFGLGASDRDTALFGALHSQPRPTSGGSTSNAPQESGKHETSGHEKGRHLKIGGRSAPNNPRELSTTSILPVPEEEPVLEGQSLPGSTLTCEDMQ